MKREHHLGIWGALFWCASGCNEFQPIGDIESKQSPIILGEEIPQHELASLGIIELIGSGGESCTGTLLNNSIVLTAHHCVRDEDGDPFSSLFAVEKLNEQSSLIRAEIIYEPSESVVSKGAQDFALLRLTRPANVEGTTIGHFRSIFEGTQNDVFELSEVRCYGYGYYELATDFRSARGSGTLRAANFKPRRVAAENTIQVHPNWVNELNYQMIAPGDSGGPCLDSSGAIVGITSWGDDTRIDLNNNGIETVDEVADIHAVYLSSSIEFREIISSFYRNDVTIAYRTIPSDLINGSLYFRFETPALTHYGELARASGSTTYALLPDGSTAYFKKAGVSGGDLNLRVVAPDGEGAVVCESVHRVNQLDPSGTERLSGNCYDAGLLSILL